VSLPSIRTVIELGVITQSSTIYEIHNGNLTH
jgi:hypothetical protein